MRRPLAIRNRLLVVCVGCGREVPRTSHRQKHCSAKCRTREHGRARVRKALLAQDTGVAMSEGSDDEHLLALHPLVREAIYQENRDRPLTLNWTPIDPDAYTALGLPKLPPNALKARDQIITEALVARFSQIEGYKCLSLTRALGIVKCQLALV